MAQPLEIQNLLSRVAWGTTIQSFVRIIVNLHMVTTFAFIGFGFFHFVWWHTFLIGVCAGVLSGIPIGYMRANRIEYSAGHFFIYAFVVLSPITIAVLYSHFLA